VFSAHSLEHVVLELIRYVSPSAAVPLV
jgi:hypothetical protein